MLFPTPEIQIYMIRTQVCSPRVTCRNKQISSFKNERKEEEEEEEWEENIYIVRYIIVIGRQGVFMQIVGFIGLAPRKFFSLVPLLYIGNRFFF